MRFFLFTDTTRGLFSSGIIKNILNMLQLSKEKQFTWEKANFLQAQKTEKIQEQEKHWLKISMEISTNPDAYLEPSRASTMEFFAKIFNGLSVINYFWKKLHHKCLIKF